MANTTSSSAFNSAGSHAASNLSSGITWTNTNTSQGTTTTLNGIYGGTTAYGYSYTYDDLFNTRLDVFTLVVTGLQESKIVEIMDILSSNLSADEFKKVIKCTVGSRHFSEDFLLKYIDYLDQDTLFMQHRENIKSREYESVALYLETKEKQ